MNILSFIKAPSAIQVYRLFFTVCAFYFGSFVWQFRRIGSPDGLLILGGLAGGSLLGFVYTWIRSPRSRWVLALLGILLPGTVFVGMCFLVFSRPEGWWDWLGCGLVTAALFTLPVTFAVALFRDQKTHEYFTKSAA